MSCTIQNYGFTKNGQWVDSNCRALITDSIACKANIYFDSAVGDIYLWFNVKFPDNSVTSWRYNYTISSSGTQSIDVGMGTLAAGNYYINSVVVTDKANTYQMCSASGTPNNCRSLSVTACSPPGGVQRYCGSDNKTIYVWNQVACKYDSALCSTGHCSNGYCDAPPMYNACVGDYCNQQVCPDSGCPANQCTTIGASCGPTTGTCDVYIKDNNTSAFISGASVTIGGVTKVTNSSGFAGTWTLSATSSGTAYAVTVTKSGYENGTYNAVIVAGLLRTRTYYMIPVVPTTGTCDVYIKKYDTTEVISGASVTINGVTKTTDGNGFAGTWTMNATTSGTNYTATITKSGYEDTSGNVLVKAGLLVTGTFYIKPIVIPKYNCVAGECQGPFTSGTYNSLAECQTARKYACINNSCTIVCPDYSGTKYNSLAECQAACIVTPTKYNCVSGQCQGPYTTGQYNSYADCVVACAITQKWKCIDPATNTCVQAADGTFDTEALCKAATSCQPSGAQTWYCNASTKVCSLQAGSGGYATKAACDAVCTGGGGADCPNCDTTKNFCILGQCIEKNTAYVAGALIFGLIILKK